MRYEMASTEMTDHTVNDSGTSTLRQDPITKYMNSQPDKVTKSKKRQKAEQKRQRKSRRTRQNANRHLSGDSVCSVSSAGSTNQPSSLTFYKTAELDTDFFINHEIRESAKDGWCLLTSFVKSVNSQKPELSVNRSTIQNNILSTISNNWSEYSPFLPGISKRKARNQLNKYFKEGNCNYDVPVVDILPLIISKSFNISLHIVSENSLGYELLKVNDSADKLVYILKQGDHYDAIVNVNEENSSCLLVEDEQDSSSSSLVVEDEQVNAEITNESTCMANDSVLCEDIGAEDGDSTPPSTFTQLMMDSDNSSDPTSPSALRIQLGQMAKENSSLHAENELLHGELKSTEKSLKALRDEIKRLKNENNSVRRELSKHTGMRRFVTPNNATPDKSAPQATPKPKSSLFPKTGARTCKPTNKGIAAPHQKQHTTMTQSAKPQPHQPQIQVPPAARPASNSRHRKRQQAQVFGTSLSRGSGGMLVKRGIDATTYTYPGALLPRLRESICRNINPSNAADQIVIQGGGNDLEKYPLDLVQNEFVTLLQETRRLAPDSNIIICRIPYRKYNKQLNQNIDSLNHFLDGISYNSHAIEIADTRPTFPSMFAKDKIHFNEEGKCYFGNKLACELINFQLVAPVSHW